ncbi:MAG: adenylate kinase [Thermoanaerobaculia bacterium]
MHRGYQGVVLFGPPGVGKGAQAAMLSRRRGLVHLSTGELIREEIRLGTALGRKLKDAVSRGEFADDEVVLGIVMSRIDRPEFHDGFVMDGFPRNLRQANRLDELLAARGLKVTAALFITAPDEVVLRRLAGRRVCSRCRATYHEEFQRSRTLGICDACGGPLERRHDDDPATHRDRLRTYRLQTAPLADYYQRTGVLREVDGNQSIESVSAEIARILAGVHAH